LDAGFNYATAFEWALKMKGVDLLIAEPYSSADFQHGPIAMVEGGFPVLAVAPNGKVHETMRIC
jgi:glutamine---fructose-6-phosphate transaminase (isomerizing)